MAKVSFLDDATLYHVYLYPIVPALRKYCNENSLQTGLFRIDL